MDETADWLAARFEEQRTHLRAVAYRMLGSQAEAEDAVQNSWLRLSGADTSEVQNLAGWLTTVVARECLKMLRSRRVRREEPLADVEMPAGDPETGDPEAAVLLADSGGPALMVVLDTLAPAERLAFVLHDVFAVHAWPSSCTTSSPCPSTTSPRSWSAPRSQRASWPAGPAAGSRARPRPARSTWPASGG